MTGDSTTAAVGPLGMRAAPRSWKFAIAAALTYPTLLTLVYFVLLADFPASVQQSAYTLGKCLQFLFPLVWVVVVCGERPRLRWPGMRGVPTGLAFGLAVLVATAAVYLGWFRASAALAGLELQAVEKVRDLGLDRFWKYAATGVFYALAHSLLEEYYWRWFVFGQLHRYAPLSTAIGVSSLGFMAHHVVLLATFLGWQSPLTYLFSLAVAVGGAVWAWLYASSRSLLGPWLSHMLVDLAIFVIGYDLVRELLTGAVPRGG
ncbi:MAG: CPBP family intramembrane metalloprotease [Pirellulaceae bacterium]|nr:CPBP family intramembrane metalloprotease [Pirellulaceae bacterium]